MTLHLPGQKACCCLVVPARTSAARCVTGQRVKNKWPVCWIAERMRGCEFLSRKNRCQEAKPTSGFRLSTSLIEKSRLHMAHATPQAPCTCRLPGWWVETNGSSPGIDSLLHELNLEAIIDVDCTCNCITSCSFSERDSCTAKLLLEAPHHHSASLVNYRQRLVLRHAWVSPDFGRAL
jgi:hypothetical protein